jgi:hypothetical protein
LELRHQLSLEKIQHILHFWGEITMTQEEKEKRVRKEGDKRAKEAMDQLFGDPNATSEDIINKVQITTELPDAKNQVNDPESLKRYLEIIGK